MKLTEYEGRKLFRTYGVVSSREERIEKGQHDCSLSFPIVLKSQVPAGDRKAKGGIRIIASEAELASAIEELFAHPIDGQLPEYLLATEYVTTDTEAYMSFSYSGDSRSPVLALNHAGGTGVHEASITPIDLLEGCDESIVRAALVRAGMPESSELVQTILNLWRLFETEKVMLAEINPLFILADGSVLAGDAKIVCDDALFPAEEKAIVPLGGDIAILASGGGASMLNMDMLMRAGGRPANYVEYSGNPPASVVEELTVRVLGQPGLRGVWVVGGTANFTDIYETMSGFVAGLRRIQPKPTYPIVIRRDGPRRQEAQEMLARVAKEEGFDLQVFGPETSMAQSADFLLQRMSRV
ncbi:MAG: ATP citrate lyase citrate-binding domain-containing protein [Minisyncoccia bacterium]